MENMGAINSANNAIVGHFSNQLGTLMMGTKASKVQNTEQVEPKKQGLTISGDTVNFSEQSKQLTATFKGPKLSTTGTTEEEEKKESGETSAVEEAKARIKEIQQEIEKIKNSSLPEEEKRQKLEVLNQELVAQTTILQQEDSNKETLQDVASLALL